MTENNPQLTTELLFQLIKSLSTQAEKAPSSMKTSTLLKGEENFHSWKMTVDQMLENKERAFKSYSEELKSWVWTTDLDKLNKAKEFILNSIEDNCKSILNRSDNPNEMLEKLSLRYGGINGKDVDLFKSEINVFFPKHINPVEIFDRLDSLLAKLSHAGGRMTPTEEVVILVNGLKDLTFWKMVRGEILQKKLSEWTPMEVRKKIQSGWQAFGGPESKKEHLKLKKNEPNEPKIKVNQVWVAKFCDHCRRDRPTIKTKHGKHPIYETHNTVDCQIHENKDASKYLDTCANKSVFNQKPLDAKPYKTQLNTANGNKVDIIGKGRDNIQNLQLDEVYYAPELTHNLVSGPDLMKKGYDLFFTKNRFEVLKVNEENPVQRQHR